MKLSEGQTRDLLRDARDEINGALIYCVKHRLLSVRSPQAMRLRALLDRLVGATEYRAKIPKGYPMNQN